MKKSIRLMLVLFCMTLACVFAVSQKAEASDILSRNPFEIIVNSVDSTNAPTISISHFPGELHIIEDSAFEGTALEVVAIPESINRIGERAFADADNLRLAFFPEKSFELSRTAFAGSNRLILTGGDYVRKYAAETGISYASVTAMAANPQSPQESLEESAGELDAAFAVIAALMGMIIPLPRRAVETVKAKQRDQSVANHILGRSPPVVR